MWLDHLQTVREHRQAGAKKAAETRRKKRLEKGQDKETRRKKDKKKKNSIQEDEDEIETEVKCFVCIYYFPSYVEL